MKNTLHSFYWITLSLIGLLIISLLWLVSTTAGSQWLIHQAIRYSDQNISIDGFRGTLVDELTVDKFTYVSPDKSQSLKVTDLRINWTVEALFKGLLHVNNIEAAQIKITDKKTSEPSLDPEPFSLPAFSLPIVVQIDQLSVAEISHASSTDSPTVINDFRLTGRLKDSLLKLQQLTLRQKDITANGEGEITFADPFPLKVGLVAKDSKKSVTANLKVDGVISKFNIDAQGAINQHQLPAAKARLQGSGSLTDINIGSLVVNTLDGELILKGSVSWEQDLDAKLDFSGKDINPGVYYKEMPGQIGLKGSLEWQKDQFDIDASANGKLRNYPLEVSLAADGNSSFVSLHTAKLHSGPNTLNITGELSSKKIRQLDWQISAPKLRTLHGQLDGSLTGAGKLAGSWPDLRLEGQLQGKRLKFDDYAVNQFQVSVSPSTEAPLEHHLLCNLTEMKLKGQSVDTFKLKLSGTPDQHQGDFVIQLEQKNKIQGKIANHHSTSWQTTLSAIAIQSSSWPDLKQDQPATITFQDKQFELTPLCLQGKKESLCLSGRNTFDETQGVITLVQIPLERLKSWIGEAGQLEDKLSGEIKVSRQQKEWKLQPLLQLDKNNQIRGTAVYHADSQQINGEIKANFNRLEWLTLFTDQLQDPQGNMRANLVLKGTIKQPDIMGEVSLSQASVKVPDLAVTWRDISLNIKTAKYGQSEIQGNITSADGNLLILGTALWAPLDQLNLDLSVKGDNFQVANLAEIRTTVSPDIDINIQKKQVRIDGVITVPTANIELIELPEKAVQISQDAHIIGSETAEDRSGTVLPVNADIQIRLGEKVHLHGRGLDARLGGKFNIKETPNKPILAYGEIEIPEGSYQAYGQDLSLQQGKIIFNGPVQTPGLDLKAERKIGEITVGLLIGGTLQNPQSEIYSNPAMSQSDAIAYLITGKPLRTAGTGEGALIANALTRLGVKGSAGTIEEVRNATGLSTLEIDAGANSAETALLVGKYLTPQLYVQYVKRLFEKNDSLQLRYELSEKLHLEAESGTSQGIDLYYQFER